MNTNDLKQNIDKSAVQKKKQTKQNANILCPFSFYFRIFMQNITIKIQWSTVFTVSTHKCSGIRRFQCKTIFCFWYIWENQCKTAETMIMWETFTPIYQYYMILRAKSRRKKNIVFLNWDEIESEDIITHQNHRCIIYLVEVCRMDSFQFYWIFYVFTLISPSSVVYVFIGCCRCVYDL